MGPGSVVSPQMTPPPHIPSPGRAPSRRCCSGCGKRDSGAGGGRRGAIKAERTALCVWGGALWGGERGTCGPRNVSLGRRSRGEALSARTTRVRAAPRSPFRGRALCKARPIACRSLHGSANHRGSPRACVGGRARRGAQPIPAQLSSSRTNPREAETPEAEPSKPEAEHRSAGSGATERRETEQREG